MSASSSISSTDSVNSKKSKKKKRNMLAEALSHFVSCSDSELASKLDLLLIPTLKLIKKKHDISAFSSLLNHISVRIWGDANLILPAKKLVNLFSTSKSSPVRIYALRFLFVALLRTPISEMFQHVEFLPVLFSSRYNHLPFEEQLLCFHSALILLHAINNFIDSLGPEPFQFDITPYLVNPSKRIPSSHSHATLIAIYRQLNELPDDTKLAIANHFAAVMLMKTPQLKYPFYYYSDPKLVDGIGYSLIPPGCSLNSFKIGIGWGLFNHLRQKDPVTTITFDPKSLDFASQHASTASLIHLRKKIVLKFISSTLTFNAFSPLDSRALILIFGETSSAPELIPSELPQGIFPHSHIYQLVVIGLSDTNTEISNMSQRLDRSFHYKRRKLELLPLFHDPLTLGSLAKLCVGTLHKGLYPTWSSNTQTDVQILVNHSTHLQQGIELPAYQTLLLTRTTPMISQSNADRHISSSRSTHFNRYESIISGLHPGNINPTQTTSANELVIISNVPALANMDTDDLYRSVCHLTRPGSFSVRNTVVSLFAKEDNAPFVIRHLPPILLSFILDLMLKAHENEIDPPNLALTFESLLPSSNTPSEREGEIVAGGGIAPGGMPGGEGMPAQLRMMMQQSTQHRNSVRIASGYLASSLTRLRLAENGIHFLSQILQLSETVDFENVMPTLWSATILPMFQTFSNVLVRSSGRFLSGASKIMDPSPFSLSALGYGENSKSLIKLQKALVKYLLVCMSWLFSRKARLPPSVTNTYPTLLASLIRCELADEDLAGDFHSTISALCESSPFFTFTQMEQILGSLLIKLYNFKLLLVRSSIARILLYFKNLSLASSSTPIGTLSKIHILLLYMCIDPEPKITNPIIENFNETPPSATSTPLLYGVLAELKSFVEMEASKGDLGAQAITPFKPKYVGPVLSWIIPRLSQLLHSTPSLRETHQTLNSFLSRLLLSFYCSNDKTIAGRLYSKVFIHKKTKLVLPLISHNFVLAHKFHTIPQDLNTRTKLISTAMAPLLHIWFDCFPSHLAAISELYYGPESIVPNINTNWLNPSKIIEWIFSILNDKSEPSHIPWFFSLVQISWIPALLSKFSWEPISTPQSSFSLLLQFFTAVYTLDNSPQLPSSYLDIPESENKESLTRIRKWMLSNTWWSSSILQLLSSLTRTKWSNEDLTLWFDILYKTAQKAFLSDNHIITEHSFAALSAVYNNFHIDSHTLVESWVKRCQNTLSWNFSVVTIPISIANAFSRVSPQKMWKIITQTLGNQPSTTTLTNISIWLLVLAIRFKPKPTSEMSKFSIDLNALTGLLSAMLSSKNVVAQQCAIKIGIAYHSTTPKLLEQLMSSLTYKMENRTWLDRIANRLSYASKPQTKSDTGPESSSSKISPETESTFLVARILQDTSKFDFQDENDDDIRERRRKQHQHIPTPSRSKPTTSALDIYGPIIPKLFILQNDPDPLISSAIHNVMAGHDWKPFAKEIGREISKNISKSQAAVFSVPPFVSRNPTFLRYIDINQIINQFDFWPGPISQAYVASLDAIVGGGLFDIFKTFHPTLFQLCSHSNLIIQNKSLSSVTEIFKQFPHWIIGTSLVELISGLVRGTPKILTSASTATQAIFENSPNAGKMSHGFDTRSSTEPSLLPTFSTHSDHPILSSLIQTCVDNLSKSSTETIIEFLQSILLDAQDVVSPSARITLCHVFSNLLYNLTTSQSFDTSSISRSHHLKKLLSIFSSWFLHSSDSSSQEASASSEAFSMVCKLEDTLLLIGLEMLEKHWKEIMTSTSNFSLPKVTSNVRSLTKVMKRLDNQIFPPNFDTLPQSNKSIITKTQSIYALSTAILHDPTLPKVPTLENAIPYIDIGLSSPHWELQKLFSLALLSLVSPIWPTRTSAASSGLGFPLQSSNLAAQWDFWVSQTCSYPIATQTCFYTNPPIVKINSNLTPLIHRLGKLIRRGKPWKGKDILVYTYGILTFGKNNRGEGSSFDSAILLKWLSLASSTPEYWMACLLVCRWHKVPNLQDSFPKHLDVKPKVATKGNWISEALCISPSKNDPPVKHQVIFLVTCFVFSQTKKLAKLFLSTGPGDTATTSSVDFSSFQAFKFSHPPGVPWKISQYSNLTSFLQASGTLTKKLFETLLRNAKDLE